VVLLAGSAIDCNVELSLEFIIVIFQFLVMVGQYGVSGCRFAENWHILPIFVKLL